MNEEFIPYEEALVLKELGFEQSNCYGEYRQWDGCKPWLNIYQDWSPEDSEQYTKECEAPLYQQVFRWFREKHDLYIEMFVDDDKTFGFMISYFIEKSRGDKPIQRRYASYKEAELACIKKLIEITKSK